MEKEVVLQIFSGDFNGEAATFDAIRQKLEPLARRNVSLRRVKSKALLCSESPDSLLASTQAEPAPSEVKIIDAFTKKLASFLHL
ncbi:MAG: hypothetical protein FWD60_06860 [Candidatus Azobacteroides sp.]|nr:hypothetical protein [Candidatus Azobacteroides sp.]